MLYILPDKSDNYIIFGQPVLILSPRFMKNIPSQNTIHYHEETKHYPRRYARSTGSLDWENQPDPFRSYHGADILKLPFVEKDPTGGYLSLFERNNRSHDFSIKSIAGLLELSLGLSAWKSLHGSSWPLRMNPSSGNLHPTEAHLILPPLPENNNSGVVCHYNPCLHALEIRAYFQKELWLRIKEHFRRDGILIGLTSIFWRESWKYGERAFRYCNHDVGHAMACLSFSANLLGWKITYLNSLSDHEIETILGLQKTEWPECEKEHPEALFFIYKCTNEDIPRFLPRELISSFETIQFKGKPNLLSKEHVEWQIIDNVASYTLKPRTEAMTYKYKDHCFFKKGVTIKKGAEIIRQRRSGLDYDRKTSITKEQFFSILDKTIPRSLCSPFDLELGEVSIHLLLFVHKVAGLEPGLYLLIRDEKDLEEIKAITHPQFLWKRIQEATEPLYLYLLKPCDIRYEAQMVSCDQEIAGDGVFSVGMIAKFRENIENAPYLYRHLFWETGMIGQVLYLEAEAHSVRGTGIGCFYDDMVHQILGFNDNTYQDLYHFTIGGPVEDTRLTTLPPYYHLKDL